MNKIKVRCLARYSVSFSTKLGQDFHFFFFSAPHASTRGLQRTRVYTPEAGRKFWAQHVVGDNPVTDPTSRMGPRRRRGDCTCGDVSPRACLHAVRGRTQRTDDDSVSRCMGVHRGARTAEPLTRRAREDVMPGDPPWPLPGVRAVHRRAPVDWTLSPPAQVHQGRRRDCQRADSDTPAAPRQLEAQPRARSETGMPEFHYTPVTLKLRLQVSQSEFWE